MTSTTQSTTTLTGLALDAIQQRFPENEIKALYVRLLRKPKEENIIKVQLSDNTFWTLRQNMTGKMVWKQMDVPVG